MLAIGITAYRWFLHVTPGIAGLMLFAASLVAHAQPVSPQPFAAIEAEMHTASILRLAVDAAGRYAVTASFDKTARVWDLASGKLLIVLRVPVGEDNEGKLYAAALSPDGRLVALGGWTGPTGVEESIYLFDRASGRLQERIGGLPQRVHHLAFSANGRHLAAALGGGEGIRIYAARPHWQEVARDADYAGGSYSVDFDRRGRLVATSFDGKLRLYDAALRRLAAREAPGGKLPFFARFSPDGRRIAVGFSDSTEVSVVSGEDLSPFYQTNTGSVGNGTSQNVTWSADGETLYEAGGYQLPDGRMSVRFWRQRGRGPLQSWPLASATNNVIDLRSLADGRLVFASIDPAWGVLDANGRLLAGQTPPTLDHRADFNSFRLAPSGETVQFLQMTWRDGSWQQSLARFDLSTRRLERGVSSQEGLAVPRTEGLPVRYWQNSTAPLLGERALELEPDEISICLAISPDARRFALGTEWHLNFFDNAGRRLWRKPVPGAAWLVNLSADGRFVVAALGDGTLRWYRTQDGSEALALFVHADGERWVLWTPEGFYDASPGADSLLGYRLNQGRDKEGEFVGAGQLVSIFYRPDLLARRLAGDEASISAAVKAVGDVRQVLAAGLAPQLELLSPKDSASNGDYDLKVRIAERSGGTGKVELRINGKMVDSRADPPTGGMYSQRLSLAEGRNVISTVLYSRDNKQASRPVEAVVNVAPSGEKPTLHVLAVGVSDYRDAAFATEGIRYAAADARAVAAKLKERGSGLYRSVETVVLSRPEEVTLARIDQELTALAKRYRPQDVAIIYLAGHGRAVDGKYHFIPGDMVFENENSLRRGALTQARLEGHLKSLGSGKQLLVIDTCHAGAMTQTRAGQDERFAIANLMKMSGSAILAATLPDQLAIQDKVKGHGVYTFSLLEGLDGAADAGRGLINVDELAGYLARVVPGRAASIKDGVPTGALQRPMRSTEGEPFDLVRSPRKP